MKNHQFHTVYLSYEAEPSLKKYVGKHSTGDPYDDYFGSFSDSSFNPVGKHILGVYKTSEGATYGEIMWQKVLNVVEDPEFVNRAFQTATGFDTTGRVRPVEETRPGGLAMKGMLVWNNGNEQTRSKTRPGPEWVRGYLEDPFKGNRANHSKTPWWHNPGTKETRRSETSPGSGWVEGRGDISANTDLWECTITGHITTPGPLSRYQKARGINPANRRRIS